MKARSLLAAAAISGAFAVSLGAFGAHALKDFLVASGRVDTYETAVSYHFYHTLALLGVGALAQFNGQKGLMRAGWFLLAGMLIFSGSLYLLCFTNVGILGAVTPFGGVALIMGWGQLAWVVLKSTQTA